MKTLYEASNALDAHVVRDLLEREGITAHVHGEHLQGAMGELPVTGLVRLVVDEAEYPRARALIDRWDADQVAEPVERSTQPRSWLLVAFLLGLALGVGVAYASFRSPLVSEGVDHDGDGLLDDRWTYTQGGLPVRNEVDRNLDGLVDYVSHYDERGVMASGESDDDFDGVFETRVRVRLGNYELSEVDTDGDGYRELRSRFENGVLASTEYLDASTGLPLRVEHYRLGKLIKAEEDTNGDGTLDTRLTYSGLGHVSSTEPMSR